LRATSTNSSASANGERTQASCDQDSVLADTFSPCKRFQ
jgi:hypothetical protein